MIKLNRPECPNPAALATNYKHRDNKEALMKASFYKCMYCESKTTHIVHGDIEHIKPKSKYPHLKFEWNNLGYACNKCNRDHKKDKYHDDFINPYDVDPEDFIEVYGCLITSKDGHAKGDITIDFLNLNRPALLEKRLSRIKKLIPLINKYFQCSISDQREAVLEQIFEESFPDKEYSLCSKSLIRAKGLST